MLKDGARRCCGVVALRFKSRLPSTLIPVLILHARLPTAGPFYVRKEEPEVLLLPEQGIDYSCGSWGIDLSYAARASLCAV